MKNGRSSAAAAGRSRAGGARKVSARRRLIPSAPAVRGILLLAAAVAFARPEAAAAPREASVEWGVKVFRDPQAALRRAADPLSLAERLLEAGETAAVENFRAGLNLPQQAGLESQLRSLQALYAGDYEAARRALDEAPAGAWTESRTDYLDGLLRAATGFVEIPSDHFRFRVRAEDAFLGDYALKALENAWTKMGEAFSVVPDTSVVAEIYPGGEKFSAASTLPPETLERSGAVGICKFGRLMVLSPRALPLGYRWLDALSHEYNHHLINRLSGGLCPLWLHEGAARYYETAWRRAGPFRHSPAAEAALARASAADSTAPVAGLAPSTSTGTALIPFRRMEPSMVYLENQEQVALAFAQVSDAVAFLADRFGPEKPAEILAAYRRLPRDEVFLGMTEEEFEDAWRRSLRERSWPADTGAMAQTIRLSPVDETEFLGADARGHVRLGDRLRSQGQAAAALLQYKKALQQEPDNGVALVKAARAHLDLEQTDKAEEVLRRAVEKNESYVTPYVLLGEILFDDGRYEDAQQILQEALEINPFHPRVHETLGLVALDVGNFPAARRSMELSLSLDPSNEELRQALKRMPKRDK
jgi:hypothetical protein